MKEFTARSFAEEYKVCEKTAREHLNSLVENGKATAVKKPFSIMSKGRKVETRRTVTIYRIEKGFIPGHRPDSK